MRPTWGLVPATPEGESFLHPISTNGPMARSPGDLALLLGVMGGPEARQPYGRVVPDLDLGSGAKGARIAWLADWGGAFPYEEGIAPLCEAALEVLAEEGAEVEPLSPPFDRDLLWHSWTTLRSWAMATQLAPLLEALETRDQLKPEAIWEIERGRALSALEVHNASEIRSEWFRVTAGLFETYDALALPTAQVWPFPVEWDWPREVAGQAMDSYHRWMEVMVPASLAGLPAVAMPAGFGANGLPMGLQLIGPRGGDGAMLRVAQGYHEATEWPGQRPMIT
jgi:amidase